ncbi:syntaxin-1A-like [Uloborus diversus]|uniref:syntaxin-1A-like n=1 Tax=Uloborus diversus TaxID=327109 RepID=UPI00240A21D0|nr:syntaxin-1A-like [Uloborus diversus]
MEKERVALFNRIQENIEDMDNCILQIRKKYSRILSSPFYEEDIYRELDKLMNRVQRLSAQTWGLLKTAKENRRKEDFSKRCSIRMEDVQISTLSQQFLDVLASYSAAQSEYREKKKKLLKRQLEITGKQVDDNELEKMLDENTAVFTQDYIVEVERAREDLTDVKERYTEILRIENSLRELDDMLLSLSILISSQGEIIDSVEHHIARASEDVREGTEEIAKAVKSKRKLRKVRILVIVAVIFLVCLLTGIIILVS